MSDNDYSELLNFIQTTLLKDNVDTHLKDSVYEFLNTFPRINIVNCKDCMFHLDCQIEKLIPDTECKFCSYGKKQI